MICAQLLSDNTLRAVHLSIGEKCPYIQLIETDDINLGDVVTPEIIGSLFLAAIGLYSLSFVFNILLRQILNR